MAYVQFNDSRYIFIFSVSITIFSTTPTSVHVLYHLNFSFSILVFMSYNFRPAYLLNLHDLKFTKMEMDLYKFFRKLVSTSISNVICIFVLY